MFFVVGVLKGGTIFSSIEQYSIYAPSTTLLNTFNLERQYATFGAILHDNTAIETFETRLRDYIAKEIGFHEDDRSALYIINVQQTVKLTKMLFKGIDKFLWALGLCFILSGMIGVMNIIDRKSVV